MMPKRWLCLPLLLLLCACPFAPHSHHYWDLIEDYSIQRAIAFLSPRGEGAFEVFFPFEVPLDRVRAGDYGRDWLLKRERTDLRILRTPLR